MNDKNFIFSVSNWQKCFANLRTQPIHFRQDFDKYKTQKVKNVIVLNDMHILIINGYKYVYY